MGKDYSNSTDAEIWIAFKAGCNDAYAYIYKKNAPVLYNYGCKISQNKELVEDCIQDLFIYILTHKSTLSDTDSIKYYLFKALRREIVSKLNNLNKHVYSNELYAQYDFQIVFSHEAELIEKQLSKERKEMLGKALNNLPGRQKEALFLRFYDDLGYAEIASIMGIDQKSVYKVIYKAIEALQQSLVYEIGVVLILASVLKYLILSIL